MYCEFLKTIPDAALLADDEGGIVWANQMAVKLFGGSGNVLWAQNIREVIPELSPEAHDQRMQCYWDNPATRPLDNRDRLAALRQD